MKLKFKVQPYQTQAVNAVVDCFAGQPMSSGITYRIDPGRKVQTSAFDEGFKNADLLLTEPQVLGQHPERPTPPEPAHLGQAGRECRV